MKESDGILSPRERIIQVALNYLGAPAVPYRGRNLGRSPIEGFDCSGFVGHVLVEAGITVGSYITTNGKIRQIRHTSEFFDHFGIYIPFGKQQVGDLVFFSWKGTFPQHAGIVISEDQYLHAHAGDGDVKKARLKQRPIGNPEINAIYTINPIGFKRPTIAVGTERWPQQAI